MVMQKNWFFRSTIALPMLVALAGVSAPVFGQNITPAQKVTAQEVAAKGVPLSALAPNAPERYPIKQGDTLWSIATLYLTSPWRWPELWGMNQGEIKNPNRIYPGQVLVLDKTKETALLKVQQQEGSETASIPLVKVSPQTRYAKAEDLSVPSVQSNMIEPFLVRPLIVDPNAMQRAPRIVSAPDARVLITRGDRAYALSVYAEDQRQPQLTLDQGKSRSYRIFRDAQALKDPSTGEVLAHEAKYVGAASLIRPEIVREVTNESGDKTTRREPATFDITDASEEIRAGDKLLPEPARSFASFVPHAPDKPVNAQIMSVYGNGVRFAGQNQVVSINQGSAQGIEPGHVLAIQTNSVGIKDKTDPARPDMTLPTERNGLLMVFRVFERVSYGLVFDIVDGVQVGDRLTNPR
jgi:LysM repeat protein